MQPALALVVSLGLLVPALTPAPASPDLAPLPADIKDSEVVILLAATTGLELARPLPVIVPVDASLPEVALRLGERSGMALSPEDVAAFVELDPRVSVPVMTLLVALEQAWDMRDHTFADVPEEDIRAAAHEFHAGVNGGPAMNAVAEQVARQEVFEAALLVLVTLEEVVIPALQRAIDAGAWPDVAVADPVGVLRIGSPGDDVETVNRIVQIDPSGNDAYYNNAGASTLLADFNPVTPDFPVALSIDLGGDDHYEYHSWAQAVGFMGGFGHLYDYGGDDTYVCTNRCQAVDGLSIAILHDYDGNDAYSSQSNTKSLGTFLAMLRDDAGNEEYHALGGTGGGVAGAPYSVGLLWDRGGVDAYRTGGFAALLYGWGLVGGRGWLVDEGIDIDYYQTESHHQFAHGCNDCKWRIGTGFDGGPIQGGGIDGAGGLAWMLAQEPRL